MHNIFKKISIDKNNNYNLFFIKPLYTKKKGLTENRTRIKGIRILCANHYTIRPIKDNIICLLLVNS